MFTSPTTLGVLAALVGAGAYGAPQAGFLAAGEDGCAQAMMEIRTARALLHLMHDGRYGQALTGLDRAAWMARQGRLAEAEDALQDALTALRATLVRA